MIFILVIHTNILIAQPSDVHSKTALDEIALNYLVTTLEKQKIYSSRYPQFPSCVEFITEVKTKHYVEVRLREKHDGGECKGDPNFAPTLDVYKITFTKPPTIYLLDPVTAEFSPLQVH